MAAAALPQRYTVRGLPNPQYAPATGIPGEYEATVPAGQLSPEWDFIYFYEVMDQSGNGKIYPDLEKEAPYVIVELIR